MRSICTVSVNFSSLSMKPGAKTITSTGAASTPTAVTTSSTAPRLPATCAASSRTSSWPRWLLYSPRIGTKAWENAPSANRRRSRFGSRKATKKASVSRLAPKAQAMTTSRTSPSTRESTVLAPTVAVDLSRRVLNRATGRAGSN